MNQQAIVTGTTTPPAATEKITDNTSKADNIAETTQNTTPAPQDQPTEKTEKNNTADNNQPQSPPKENTKPTESFDTTLKKKIEQQAAPVIALASVEQVIPSDNTEKITQPIIPASPEALKTAILPAATVAELISQAKPPANAPAKANSTQPAADQNQTNTVLTDTSGKTIIAQNEPANGENSEKMQLANNTPGDTKVTTEAKVAEKPASQSANNDAKIAKNDTSNQKSPITDTQTTSNDSKTAPLNDNLAAVQANSSPVQQQKPAVNSQKSAQTPEKSLQQEVQGDQKDQTSPNSLSTDSKETTESDQSNNIFNSSKTEQNSSSATQGKIDTAVSDNGNSKPQFKQILSTSNPVAEDPSPPAPMAKPQISASTDQPATSTTQQVQESISSVIRDGNQQITIRLNPPELGKIVIKFQKQGNEILGHLEVSSIQTKAEIQQALPQILQNLTDQGIQIKKMEVTLANQDDVPTSKQDSSTLEQNLWSSQQDSTNHNGQSNENAWMSVNEFLSDTESYSESGEPQIMAGNNAINMLV